MLRTCVYFEREPVRFHDVLNVDVKVKKKRKKEKSQGGSTDC